MNRFTIAALIPLILGTSSAFGQTADVAPPVRTGEQSDSSTTSGNKFPLGNKAEITGSLAIRGIQGTPGAPPLADVDVEVDLVHRGMLVDQIKARLDGHGVVVLEGIPLEMGVQPIARIDYAGVTYQQAGNLMDAATPQQTLDVVCYEVTVAPPPWTVQMRHVMVSHSAEGLLVTEVMVIENPSEQTWLGTPDQRIGREVTASFTIPTAATNVQLGKGFHGWCCTTAQPGRLASHLPMMPLVTEMSFSYVLPAEDGTTSIDLVAPAHTAQMMVIVPDDVNVESTGGLTLGGTETISDTKIRFYTASDWKKGARENLVLSRIAMPTAGTTTAPLKLASTSFKIIGGVGGGLLLIVALALLLRRKPPTKVRAAAAS